MGKKMKLIPFLSKINITDSSSSRSSWPWLAYCQQPKTLSFRTTTHDNNNKMFKTHNLAYLETTATFDVMVDTPESWFTNSCSESASFSTASDESAAAAMGGDSSSLENVIRGLRSERLFFEPGETSSILEEANKVAATVATELFPFKESVVLTMDSQDPYLDFKKSMEEMVEAHGLKDWEGLEELLCCYLKVNGKGNHGYIIGAFVDLLVGLAFASSSSSPSSIATTTSGSYNSCPCSRSRSPSSLYFYTSSNFSDDCSSSTPCVSSLEADQEEIHITSCLSSLLEVENDIKEK